MKKALITGINGQDGSYLAEFLLLKKYEVHGIIRRSSCDNIERINHLIASNKITLHYGDLTDSCNITKIITELKPDEIYNLAAQSHVKVSFEIPEYTANTDAIGTLRILEAVRSAKIEKTCKIYQASSSELFGQAKEVPQKETTPFNPCSPYACAKLYAYSITKNYRQAYKMFCVNGILFNHESERRGTSFVTRKITLAASRIAQGLQKKLYLGNLNALRDWGYAKDFVECMWLMLQQKKPDDFVIATGKQHTVKEFAQKAFLEAGIELEFKGKGLKEKGYDKKTGKIVIEINPKLFRPSDVENLLGDPTKATKVLGWNPSKTSFEKLIKIMMKHDMEYVKNEKKF
jgi:GDPmannose 4,6-dehydratase